MKRILLCFCFIFIILFSCKTLEKKEEIKEVVEENKILQEEPVEQPKIVEPVEPIVEQTADQQKEDSKDQRFEFLIEEVPKESLNDKIRDLFLAIEEKIAEGNFDDWFFALSNNYKKFISNKEVLKGMSKSSDYLYSRKIELTSPKDYFFHVVVPSRQGSTLKYIGFNRIDANNLKVNCVLDDRWNFVYYFIYEDNLWKLDRK